MPVIISAKGKRFLGMYGQGNKFQSAISGIEAGAAKVATDVSRATFTRRLSGRPAAPSRFGRPSTDGHFANDILWEKTVPRNGRTGVGLDVRRLPYYAFIQEIGTGKTAKILNPPGSVTVRSQYGRTISANLFWAQGAGGSAVGATTGANDGQLFYANELNAKSLAQVRRRKKRIRREIKGKHYIADGGVAGYLELRTRLTDEARRIFR